MATIIVKTQAEWDAIPASFNSFTVIQIRDTQGRWIYVNRAPSGARVEARENSSVVARENSSVEAWENSSVEARENSSVEARENSSVEARENSSVVAWGNSSVVARENSSVEARENSSVVARENSSVEARGNSSVVARENSSVEARENSSVEAWENVAVHALSDAASVDLFGFAVAIVVAVGSKLIRKKSKTATIVRPPEPEWTVKGWLDREGVKSTKGKVILFKRVSAKFQTQEGTRNETIWTPGATLEHPNWQPDSGECGEGKFHACSRPYFCDEFRSMRGDVYVAIEVATKDMRAWERPSYPHKIAFRKGKVIGLVTRNGKAVAK